MNYTKFALLISVLLLLPSCIKTPNTKQVVLEKPIPVADKTILIGADDYVPYEFIENGVESGISIDLVREVFKRLGYKVQYKFAPWSRTLEMAKGGELDGILSVFKSKEREGSLIYTKEPLAFASQTFYIQKHSSFSFDGTIQSLSPYKIGVIRGYSYGDDFDQAVKNRTLTIIEGESCPNNIDKLISGRIDTYIENQFTSNFYLKSKNLQDQIVAFLPPLDGNKPLYFCFSKMRNIDPKLISDFDIVLKQLKEDGTYQEIIERYTK